MFIHNKKVIAYDADWLKLSEKLVGGKAKNLFRLYRNGFNVPSWVVVSSDLFTDVKKPVSKSIADILSSIDYSNQTTIESAASEIRELIVKLDIPSSIIDQIKKKVQVKLTAGDKFAVRSSVVGEDSPCNSFAGQMDSFLNVSYCNLIGAIKDVWASAYSARALIYRHRKNLGSNEIHTAVIIQNMIASTASGVMFTRNPETQEKEFYISAGYGLGEGVVQNMAETDTYRIEWESENIKKEITEKILKITANKEEDGTHIQLLSNGSQTNPVLSDNNIFELIKEGGKVEKLFTVPQDIEWTFDDNGNLFILQSRPIVFQQTNHKNYRIWDNSNIIESYPGLTLPLTFSFIQQCYEITFKKAVWGCLLVKKELDKDIHIFKNMIGLLNGSVYYNLLNWYKMLSYLPGYKNHQKSWDRMIGISRKIDIPQTKLSALNKIYALLFIFIHLLTVKRTTKSFLNNFYRTYKRFKQIDFTALNENDLIDLYLSIEQKFSRKWHKTLYNDFCAMKYYDWLKKICHKWGLEQHSNLHNNLLCGEPDVESVKPIHALLNLADSVKADSDYKNLFKKSDDEAIWVSIISDEKYSSLKKQISLYLDKYGDRSLEELKLEVSTFRENPIRLIEIIKNYIPSDLTAQTLLQREQTVRKNAEDIVRKVIRNPLKRILISFLLKNTRLAVAGRENMRFARSRLYGIIRRLFKRMAELFVEKGILDKTGDLYYLTVPEIFNYIEGTSVNHNFKKLVRIRRNDYKSFDSKSPAGRFFHTGIPYLHNFNVSQKINLGSSVLKGIGCSSGITKGIARVITNPRETVHETDYILVAKSTDPGWVFLMLRSKGIIVERGSVLSHTAIIGRELGIPTIVAVDNATISIKDGEMIQIDGSTGVVQCL